jgi:hypothetical protein
VPLVVSIVGFLVFFFLTVLFVHKKWMVSLVAFLSGVIIMLYVYWLDQSVMLIAGGVLSLLLLGAALGGRREAEASVKIRFIRILHIVVSRSMFGIVLCATFLVYISSIAHPLDENNILFPKSVFVSMSPAVSQLVKPVFGDIDLSLTLGEMAQKGVDTTIANTTNTIVKQSLTPELRATFVQQYVKQIQDAFKKSLGINISTNQKLSDALYDGLLQKFNTLPDASKRGIILFFSIVFLIGVQAVSWIARLAIIPIAFVLYEIGIATKFVKMTFKNQNKEMITLE